jgi:hypothetical protein
MARVPASRVFGMFGNRMTAKILIGLLFAFQTALAVGADATTVCYLHREYFQGNGPENSPEVKYRHFEEQFITAENLRQKAAKADAEWLETEDLLNHSQKLANSDKWSAAFQLVYKACLQSELALQQAVTESKTWKRRVVD